MKYFDRKKKGGRLMTDEELTSKLSDRDESALGELESKYGNYCMSVAMNILRNRSDAEETTNDAYFAAWNSIPLNRPDDLKTYMAALTRNAALDNWRRAHAQKRGSGHVELLLEELSDVAASNAPLEKLGDMIAFRETFNEFLGKLKPEQRRIFLLRYWYMDKIEEISDKLGISENKVKVSLHRTRNKLKKLLEREGLL